MSRKNFLVTGGAGFIGSHLVEDLLKRGHRVVCLDNFDGFYAPEIKRSNILPSLAYGSCTLLQSDIRDRAQLRHLFSSTDFDAVVHLAARAGVRDSIAEPLVYQEINIQGTINMLEECRTHGVGQFVFASSSSVYGDSNVVPFDEQQKVACPASPYAASKAAAELFCYSYHHLYGFPVMVLRFFSVYGPRQRPEMAIHRFTRLIDAGEEIPVFGDGTSERDYTYVSDVVDGIVGALTYDRGGFEIFNLGNSSPVSLERVIRLIEEALGKKARIRRLPDQPGDVPVTFASISKAETLLRYRPRIEIEEGIDRFVRWYRDSRDAAGTAPAPAGGRSSIPIIR